MNTYLAQTALDQLDRLAALCRGLSGDAAGAREAHAVLVEESERRLGPEHPTTLSLLSDVGRWIGETGDAAGAVEASPPRGRPS